MSPEQARGEAHRVDGRAQDKIRWERRQPIKPPRVP
jgi:hypothetical protein